MNDFRSALRHFRWCSHFVFLAAALLLVGCGSGIDRTLKEVVEQTYQIDPNATVSIRNAEGSIRIYGGPASELKLEAIKKAYSRDRLAKISIDVATQPAAIAIETNYPPKPKWGLFDRSGTVDYNIVLPSTCNISRAELVNGELLVEGMRGGNVHASLVNGRMLERNCFGDLHFFVFSGGLDVAYDWWEHRKFSVEAKITHGNARAFIPDDAGFHLLAETVDGHIANEFGEQAQRQRRLVQKIDTIIGPEAGAEINIQAVNGNIRIAEANP